MVSYFSFTWTRLTHDVNSFFEEILLFVNKIECFGMRQLGEDTHSKEDKHFRGVRNFRLAEKATANIHLRTRTRQFFR